MEIEVCAPAKAILLGEHFVVYGARGIVCAIEPYNRVEVRLTGEGEAGLDYTSTLKESSLLLKPRVCMKENIGMHPIAAVYCRLLSEYPKLQEFHVKANVKKCWPLKGVGNSSSLSGAFAFGIRKLVGGKAPTENELFEDVQIGDKAAHGNPSGIDASAVSMGGALLFKKRFDGREPDVKRLEQKIPEKYLFLLVDTKQLGEKKADTKVQVERFAHHYGAGKPPSELDDGKRNEIISKYEKIADEAIVAFEKGEMEKFGKCMNENHLLLKEAGVSSPAIEKAVKVCMENGAVGAKMSGAGGAGGAVIAIFEKEKMEKAKRELEKEKFECREFKIAQKGVHERENKK